jgi:hypothetical protein
MNEWMNEFSCFASTEWFQRHLCLERYYLNIYFEPNQIILYSIWLNKIKNVYIVVGLVGCN